MTTAIPGSFAHPIEVRGLSKRFKNVDAVTDLDFAVPQGSITGFLGPNGSGKTTTLRMILGLVRPTSGTATVAGVPIRLLADPARTVRRIFRLLRARGLDGLPDRPSEDWRPHFPGRIVA